MDSTSTPCPASVARVCALADQAALPLNEERAQAVALILEGWNAAANALSRRMASADHAALAPIIGLMHAPASGGAQP